MKNTLLALLLVVSSHAFAAEPTIIETNRSAAEIMEAANLAVKATSKRIQGNTMTFTARVPIEIDYGRFALNVYEDMTIDMTIVAKDGKYKVESSNPRTGRTGTSICSAAGLRVPEAMIAACEQGMVGMQAHVGNNILRQLAKSDF